MKKRTLGKVMFDGPSWTASIAGTPVGYKQPPGIRMPITWNSRAEVGP